MLDETTLETPPVEEKRHLHENGVTPGGWSAPRAVLAARTGAADGLDLRRQGAAIQAQLVDLAFEVELVTLDRHCVISRPEV
jgi:hypothetical protein